MIKVENVELYKYVKDYNIMGDYCVFVDKEDNCYQIDLFDLINYIQDYTCPDDYICNLDGLCDLVESMAANYDLPILLCLFKNLDYNISKNEWLCIDCYSWNITPFNNIEELGQIYDLAEVFEDLLEYDRTGDYCRILPKEEF